MSSPGTETLASQKKPILIAVCKSVQFTHIYDYENMLGYNTSTNYFMGNTSRNDILTWTGLGGNMTINETINYLYESDLENIKFISTNATSFNIFLLPLGQCKVIEHHLKRLFIVDFLSNSEDTKYDLFVVDPITFTNFVLPYSQMSGNNINIDVSPKITTYKDFSIKLKKKRVLTGSCMEYPTDNFNTYADCTEDENERKIMPILGCMIPWMSKKHQCLGHIKRPPGQEKLVEWLYEIVDSTWAGFQVEVLLSACHLSIIGTLLMTVKSIGLFGTLLLFP